MIKAIILVISLSLLTLALSGRTYAEAVADSVPKESPAQADTMKENDKKSGNTQSIINSNTNGLQMLEVIISTLAVLLALISIMATVAGVLVRKLYNDTRKKLDGSNEKLKKAEARIQRKNQKLELRIGESNNQLEEIIDKKIKRYEEKVESQYEEIELVSDEAAQKLEEAKIHLAKLDETDVLIKTKIAAIQKTLINCLNQAPSRNHAFSIYTNLLTAYEVLLHNDNENIDPKLEEEMEIAATRIQGNKEYVPAEIIQFMVEKLELPFKVKGILMSNS